LLENDNFQQWKNADNSSIAWLHGVQGCGKSTLVAFVINHLRKEDVKIAFLFCRQDASVSAAMRINCLTLQMLKADPEVLQALKPKYDKTVGASLTVLSTASMIFTEAVKSFGRCFIVIDALDECAFQERKGLVDALLETVKEVPTGVRILCSSRNEPDLEFTFRKSPMVVDLAITLDEIRGDIGKMVEMDIRKSLFLSMTLAAGPPDFEQYVIDRLRDGAQGMFLLPKYMVEDLDSKASVDEISRFLADLPLGLHEYYMGILQRMDQRWRPLAKRVLTWVAWAKRPLSVPELNEIFSTDGDQFPTLAAHIKGACGCLVVIEKDEITLSHSSVKRFLLESQMFRDSSLYREFVSGDPEDYLAECCTRYLFGGKYEKLPVRKDRFGGQAPDVLIKSSPFLRYAAFQWLPHCRDARHPLRFVRSIRRFLFSPQLFDWCEAVGHLITPETESLKYQCTMFQTLVVHLKHMFRDTITRAQSADLDKISLRLSQFRSFLEPWGDIVSIWPQEIHNLWPLIEVSTRLVGHGKQGFLMTGARFLRAPERLHDMLEKRSVKYGFDRFILGDLNIFLWQSLMPSTPWERAFGQTYDPMKPSVIFLRNESILTFQGSERYGIDPAEVGTMQAATVLTKDLRAVSITWARYARDKSKPLEVKTKAWIIVEGLSDAIAQRIDWTDVIDPCRVDLTVSNAFRQSKCASAFSLEDEGDFLWTAGGKYELRTGRNKPPPPLFHDHRMSALTFCSNASTIAGIRNKSRLEVYEIPRFRLVTFADGDCTILGLSPAGKFVLFIRQLQRQRSITDGGLISNTLEDMDATEETVQELCLLDREKCFQIWTYQPASDGEKSTEKLDLEFFYNNGGLHSFSDNETILVICVPTTPEWSLLAFDLESKDVVGSCWNVEYSNLLLGANILSFSFCPIHERRLYLLDSYGVMRILGIARTATSTPNISTVRAEDEKPILSAISQSSPCATLFTATIGRSKLWVIRGLPKIE
jgi:nucleoside-triphosphatase THEP1